MSRFDELEHEFNVLNYDTWSCALCHRDFVDPDEYPNAKLGETELFERHGIYWLSQTEVVCHSCACSTGIPSIEEEENA